MTRGSEAKNEPFERIIIDISLSAASQFQPRALLPIAIPCRQLTDIDRSLCYPFLLLFWKAARYHQEGTWAGSKARLQLSHVAKLQKSALCQHGDRAPSSPFCIYKMPRYTKHKYNARIIHWWRLNRGEGDGESGSYEDRARVLKRLKEPFDLFSLSLLRSFFLSLSLISFASPVFMRSAIST